MSFAIFQSGAELTVEDNNGPADGIDVMYVNLSHSGRDMSI